MDRFEKIIKETVEQYEVPYSSEAWEALSKKMGPEKGLTTKWMVGVAAGIIIIAGITWFSAENDVITKQNAININNNSSHQTSIDKVESQIIPQETKNIAELTNTDSPLNQSKNTQPTNTSNQVISNADDVDQGVEPSANPNLGTEKITSLNHEPNMVQPEALLPEETQSALNEGDNVVDYRSINLSILSDLDKLCEGKSVLLKPSVPKIKAIYQWDLGDGTIIKGSFVDHKYVKPGIYTVQLNLLDSETHQVLSSAPSKDIIVVAKPENIIDIEMRNASAIPTAYFSQLAVVDDNKMQIMWEIENTYRVSSNQFSYEFKKKGTYLVKCTIVNEFGCSRTAKEVIRIENDYNLLAPNTFSPDGDGLNETFIPKALEIYPYPFTMTIYDRSGKMVFQTTDANRPWDGLYTEDLMPAPAAPYVWVVNLTNEKGEPETYQGTVLIKR